MDAGRHDWRALIAAAVAAGVTSTLVEIMLWWFVGASPWPLLSRDARLTAAIVMGEAVLRQPGASDPVVWLSATLVHFMLSIIYAIIVARLVSRCGIVISMIIGIGFGVMVYIVNLYGFTMIFPWFVQSRGAITLLAHVVFGATLTVPYTLLRRT